MIRPGLMDPQEASALWEEVRERVDFVSLGSQGLDDKSRVCREAVRPCSTVLVERLWVTNGKGGNLVKGTAEVVTNCVVEDIKGSVELLGTGGDEVKFKKQIEESEPVVAWVGEGGGASLVILEKESEIDGPRSILRITDLKHWMGIPQGERAGMKGFIEARGEEKTPEEIRKLFDDVGVSGTVLEESFYFKDGKFNRSKSSWRDRFAVWKSDGGTMLSHMEGDGVYANEITWSEKVAVTERTGYKSVVLSHVSTQDDSVTVVRRYTGVGEI